jgi:hypothetical protein
MKRKERKQLHNTEIANEIIKFLALHFLSKGLDYVWKLLWPKIKKNALDIAVACYTGIQLCGGIYCLFDPNFFMLFILLEYLHLEAVFLLFDKPHIMDRTMLLLEEWPQTIFVAESSKRYFVDPLFL